MPTLLDGPAHQPAPFAQTPVQSEGLQSGSLEQLLAIVLDKTAGTAARIDAMGQINTKMQHLASPDPDMTGAQLKEVISAASSVLEEVGPDNLGAELKGLASGALQLLKTAPGTVLFDTKDPSFSEGAAGAMSEFFSVGTAHQDLEFFQNIESCLEQYAPHIADTALIDRLFNKSDPFLDITDRSDLAVSVADRFLCFLIGKRMVAKSTIPNLGQTLCQKAEQVLDQQNVCSADIRMVSVVVTAINGMDYFNQNLSGYMGKLALNIDPDLVRPLGDLSRDYSWLLPMWTSFCGPHNDSLPGTGLQSGGFVEKFVSQLSSESDEVKRRFLGMSLIAYGLNYPQLFDAYGQFGLNQDQGRLIRNQLTAVPDANGTPTAMAIEKLWTFSERQDPALGPVAERSLTVRFGRYPDDLLDFQYAQQKAEKPLVLIMAGAYDPYASFLVPAVLQPANQWLTFAHVGITEPTSPYDLGISDNYVQGLGRRASLMIWQAHGMRNNMDMLYGGYNKIEDAHLANMLQEGATLILFACNTAEGGAGGNNIATYIAENIIKPLHGRLIASRVEVSNSRGVIPVIDTPAGPDVDLSKLTLTGSLPDSSIVIFDYRTHSPVEETASQPMAGSVQAERDELVIKAPDRSGERISAGVYDILGNLVLSISADDFKGQLGVSIAHLPAGAYYLAGEFAGAGGTHILRGRFERLP